jgi:hypothetical protein
MDRLDTIYPDAKKLLIFDKGCPSADMIARGEMETLITDLFELPEYHV